MPRWTAECFLGSDVGIVHLETNSSTSYGARRIFEQVYGAKTVANIREIPEKSSGSQTSSQGSGAIIGLVALLGIFAYFTPWVLMIVYGGAATWLGEKITGLKIEEYSDIPDNQTTDTQHVRASVTILAALIFGGLGFLHGTQIYNEIHNESPKVEEVKSK